MKMDQTTVLTNGTIITPIREIKRGTVIIENSLIKDFGPADEVKTPGDAHTINVNGAYISPGFIDLHLHGAWGGDVMAATLGDLEMMACGLTKGGVTSFLPSTLSGPWNNIIKAVDCIDKATYGRLPGAKILGVHLEGPYFNPEQKGAQNPEYIINPKPEDYIPVFDKYQCIKRVSAAPEIKGGLELGQELRRRGIIASIAHSNATYQQVLQAIECGYTHATHVFSGMSGLRRIEAYRVSGVIESILILNELTTEMIADGHHLPPSLMKLVLKTKGLDKVCLVTDSMRAAGLGPGQYNLGGLDVVVEADIPGVFEIATQSQNYVAKLADRSSFASSVATMNQLVRNIINLVGLNIQEAVKLVTFNPAKMQKIDHERGMIARGLKADLTVFDKDINILLTIVEGQLMYRKEGF
jgi:N-acetylglucosamine-6-phosphate deacetylase